MRKVLALIVAFAFLGTTHGESPTAAGILILGDSNSEGPFGGALYDSLRALHEAGAAKPLNVTIYAKCGAGANDWIDKEYSNIDCGAWSCGAGLSLRDCRHFKDGNIPPLRDLYAELQSPRRVTLVALGLNMIIGNRQRKLHDATRLIAAIHAQQSACIWIGPPQPGDLFVAPSTYESFVADLRATVTSNNCRYIASDDKTDRRNLGFHTKDDHYSRDDAVAWAVKVIAELHHPKNAGERPLLIILGDQAISGFAQ